MAYRDCTEYEVEYTRGLIALIFLVFVISMVILIGVVIESHAKNAENKVYATLYKQEHAIR